MGAGVDDIEDLVVEVPALRDDPHSVDSGGGEGEVDEGEEGLAVAAVECEA